MYRLQPAARRCRRPSFDPLLTPFLDFGPARLPPFLFTTFIAPETVDLRRHNLLEPWFHAEVALGPRFCEHPLHRSTELAAPALVLVITTAGSVRCPS